MDAALVEGWAETGSGTAEATGLSAQRQCKSQHNAIKLGYHTHNTSAHTYSALLKYRTARKNTARGLKRARANMGEWVAEVWRSSTEEDKVN